MDSRERVLTALACRQPDRVPFMFACINPGLQEQILDRELDEYRIDTLCGPLMILRSNPTNACGHPGR